jgi:type I restriction enzyme S subunit
MLARNKIARASVIEGPWQLPPGWEWRLLGEVCRINPKRPRVERSDKQSTSFLPMQGVDEVNGVIASLETRPYREVARGFTYFEEGDVLFAKITPSMQNGKCTVARNLIDGIGFGSTEFHVLRPGPGVTPDWIHRFLRRLSFRLEAKTHFRGAVGQQRVPDEFLKTSLIPVPPTIVTQQSIIARLEAMLEDAKVVRKIVNNTQRAIEGVIDAALDKAFSKLNESCEKVSLGDKKYASVIPGQHIMASDYSIQPTGTPYITGPEDFGPRYPAVRRWTQKPKVLCVPSDVLFTVKGAGVGKINLAPADDPAAIGRQIMAIRPETKFLLTEYLFFALLGRFDEFQSLRQGAAIPGIRKEHVEAIKLPLPSISIQRQIISHLNSIQSDVDNLKRSNAKSAARLEEVEQTILEMAFRGEL